MNPLTLFKRLSLFLAILNLGLLALFLFAPPPPKSKNLKSFREIVIRELALNPEQQKQYIASTKVHRSKMDMLDKQQHDLIKEYFKNLLVNSPKTDTKKISAQIQQLEAEKITFTYLHFQELKKLCNEQQLKKYPFVLHQAIETLLLNNK